MTPLARRPAASLTALTTALAVGGAAWGGPPLPPIGGGGEDRRSDTRAYVGLSFSFGGSAAPSAGIVVGAQAIRVRSSDRLTGIDVNARSSFQDGFDRIALAGLYGNRNAYANLGGGINPRTGEFFGTAAVQGPYLRLGADLGLAGGLRPYVEVNTLGKPKRVQGGGDLACPTGYFLADPSDWTSIFGDIGDDVIVDGRTCIDSIFDGFEPPV